MQAGEVEEPGLWAAGAAEVADKRDGRWARKPGIGAGADALASSVAGAVAAQHATALGCHLNAGRGAGHAPAQYMPAATERRATRQPTAAPHMRPCRQPI